MIKQKIDINILTADFQVILTADKRETDTEFEQKFADVFHQSIFQIAFDRFVVQSQKIEIIRVFQQLFRQIGLRFRQSQIEIRHGFSLPLKQFAFDLQNKIFRLQPFRLFCEYKTRALAAFLFCLKYEHYVPREFVNNLLDKFCVGIFFGKSTHIQ